MNTYQNLNKILESIYAKSPFQKKKIEKHFSKRNERFYREAEKFSTDYLGYLENQGIELDFAVGAYLKMCSSIMHSQIKFMKTGKYLTHSSQEAYNNVYQSENEMKLYMIGLALSQFLWETHYEMYKFFVKCIDENHQGINSYFEIGPGHGLFLNKALDYLKEKTKIVIVDISSISINITKSIVNYFRPQHKNLEYHNIDILKYDSEEKFDFITMGELLEHVEHPEQLLKKLRKLLSLDGKAFVSTCVDCPAVDHVYHFHSVEEIRKLINLSGLIIENELVLPVEDLPHDEIVNRMITINYCSLLKKDL